MADRSADLRRFRANLQGEVDSVFLYSALADVEADPRTADIYRKLAAVEDRHADLWRKEIAAAGEAVPQFGPSFRARFLAWLAKRTGPASILPSIAATEARDSAVYDNQPEAVAAGLPADERGHIRAMQRAMAGDGGLPGPRNRPPRRAAPRRLRQRAARRGARRQ